MLMLPENKFCGSNRFIGDDADNVNTSRKCGAINGIQPSRDI
jgi:hypothetical protein